jgi:hypothetical protein
VSFESLCKQHIAVRGKAIMSMRKCSTHW